MAERHGHYLEQYDVDLKVLSLRKASSSHWDLGLGLMFPLSVKAKVKRALWPFEVHIALVNSEASGAEVVSLVVQGDDGHSVSTADLRTIAVDRIVSHVQVACLAWSSSEVFSADPESLTRAQRLQHTATMFRLARLLRRNTTEDVARHLGVSRATAGRLVRQCRDEGLLEPVLKQKSDNPTEES